jgi:hypothetical protein
MGSDRDNCKKEWGRIFAIYIWDLAIWKISDKRLSLHLFFEPTDGDILQVGIGKTWPHSSELQKAKIRPQACWVMVSVGKN